MPKSSWLRASLLTLLLAFFPWTPGNVYGQRERQLAPPAPIEYGSKFFDQLRILFGRFREADLERAFATAGPLACSELISDNGEWKEVAFFNEDRRLGDWFHQNLESVKTDLSAYIFKGLCRGDHSSVQLVTKFPVRESVDAYNDRRISLQQVDLNVNAPVVSAFDPLSEAYTFDLPYLFAVPAPDTGGTVYSLVAEHLSDRYDPEVTNHWECKAVHAPDVTFQFMICRTGTMPRDRALQERVRPSFGSSAYFILSDGREASTSVKLSFGTGDETKTIDVPPDHGPDTSNALTPQGWQLVDADGLFGELAHGEFRIRFNPASWANNIHQSMVLLNQQMYGLQRAQAGAGVDYCIWSPASTDLVSKLLEPEPEKAVRSVLTLSDGTRYSPVSIKFEMTTVDGLRLGAIQCFFPRAKSAAAVSFGQWAEIAGDHLALEVRP